VAILAEVTPLAFAAHHVVLNEHEVAFLEALAPGELTARLRDDADVFVPHNYRGIRWRMFVELDVGPTDAGDLHFHERSVRRNIGHRIFAKFGLARTCSHCRNDAFHRCFPPLMAFTS
jgi:hypothetical protein